MMACSERSAGIGVFLQANNRTASERILITGGGGFIGRSVAESLRADGLNPLVTTFSQKHERSTLINVNLVDHEQANDLVQNYRPQIMLHLAGVTGNADPTGKIYDDVNFTGTVNVLKALEKYGVSRVILLGTARTPFREDMLASPVSDYGLSKVKANQFALDMHAKGGFPVTILRVFTAYGYRQPKKMFLSQLIRHGLLKQNFKMSDGLQQRDFVHIDDVLAAIRTSMNAENAIGRIINIAGGKGVRLRDVAEKVWELCGADRSLLEAGSIEKSGDDSFDTEADISLAREILDWAPGAGILSSDDGYSRLREMIRKINADIQFAAGR